MLIALTSRVLVILIMVFYVSHFTIGMNEYGFVGTFYRDDAYSYVLLAKSGYPVGQTHIECVSSVGFLSIVPNSNRALLLHRCCHFFRRPIHLLTVLLWAGFFVVNISFLASAYFLFKLTNKIFNSSKMALLTVLFYSFYGASSFFSLIESEALFMALTLAAFYYLEENKLPQASVLGFLASLTRSDGFLIAIPFFIYAFQTKTAQIVETGNFIKKHFENFKVFLVSGYSCIPISVMEYSWLFYV